MSSFKDITPQTPTHPQQENINDLLQQLNDNASPSNAGNPRSNIPITQDQISVLIKCIRDQQEKIDQLMKSAATPPTSNADNSARLLQSSSMNSSKKQQITPEYYNNAKYEDLICRLIKPSYDGTAEKLVPFLNRLDIRCQDEGWAPAAYLTTMDNQYPYEPGPWQT